MIPLNKQRLLVIAPHPDDEVLGCGGFIRRIKDEGGKVFILFLTVGTTKDFSRSGISTDSQRILEIKKVASFLKFDGWRIAFPGDDYHLKLDNIPQKDIIHEIERGEQISIQTIKPTIILTPQSADYNQDHRACTEAVFAVTRPAPNDLKPLQRVVLGYESVPAEWSIFPPSTPNFFVELKSKHLKAKIEALSLYESQVRGKYHLRSARTLKNLASLRGSQSGTRNAEAFYSYRVLI